MFWKWKQSDPEEGHFFSVLALKEFSEWLSEAETLKTAETCVDFD